MFKSVVTLLIVLLVQSFSWANEEGTEAQLSRVLNSYTVAVNYAPFDLVLPSKIGMTFSYHQDENTLFEFEYLGSSISPPSFMSNLASMSERRYSAHKRTFKAGSSLNWFWGLAYNESRVHISQSLMSSINKPQASDFLEVTTLGVTWGFGNRWAIKENFVIGVDWFSWSQPLFTFKRDALFLQEAKDQDDRDKVDDILKILGYLPRLGAIKVTLGYSF